ncbi:UDP-N-acetylglucosamine 2-epimerase (non-hydrolyzing) [Geomonas sp. Red69]|uniref:UDP-N-acetylglucosamine 2-epimerase (Non-hydrolyzing) n=1 Tax=Geomonas diazotrophica TaxID=2843197 RepID=A0ABX8JNP1_9BACT|nr:MULTISPECIES: UDP-N-acetylglucosamine 2-epimerase (non-hydrolyzing) [Geomonas]MBU5637288.1 UDP-N-acetylglucosamine 2-epimerase (non-hydrolyzing) [Geomonas diazotrophica]QWV99576.1 UDP-N-acetylglucosamine 2-epimerase (non-hydrolyzing) [Geomonas nitrogeniifigens]QXE88750.1 UDP-N-acetylglucosamine 2-epimerase (non-hydrolyzing) [Geomonas nitrogeniifigens]
MNVLLVAGARPNFMKIAPIYRASLACRSVRCSIVHTGQHYDREMSGTFFEELEIPQPRYSLNAGSGSHAAQTATVMVAFEEVCLKERPDLVLVVGDVNSTLACSIVAKKCGIEVAHVEAGLRSFDLAMPEEINRMVTDAISDHFFVTEESATGNLLKEGKPAARIHEVGHVMVDNLFHQVERLSRQDVARLDGFHLKEKAHPYLFLTLHRPSNVDCRETFGGIAQALNQLAQSRTIFFPVHPRTAKMMQEHGVHLAERVVLLPPLGYREALFLWKDAEAVLTDSGGLQEETTALGIPCVTIRENTERPITVEIGSNVLAGTSPQGILAGFQESLAKKERARVPPLWDGRASERIWKVLTEGEGGANIS